MANRLEFLVENLECRKMMAADIELNGNRLEISSDEQGDIVHVQGTGVSGQVEVYVNDNRVGQFSGVESIKADMRGGDDKLNISAINISGDLNVKMGDGADVLDVDTNVTNFSDANGVDGDTRIGDDVKANLGGDQGDYVNWDGEESNGIYVVDDLTLQGVADVDLNGDGGTFNHQGGDIDVGDRLVIKMSNSGDTNGDNFEIDIDDVNVFGKTTIRGSSNVDRVDLTDNRFVDRVSIKLAGGNDMLRMNNPGDANPENYFEDKVKFNGGSGQDQLMRNPDNVFLDEVDELSFEIIV